MKKCILFIFIIALFSCNDQSKDTNKTTKTTFSINNFKPFLTKKSEDGSIIAGLESNKEQFKKLEPIGFKLKISDNEGNKIKKADVTMDLEMPGMAMPKNEIKLKEEANGIYSGTALFTMKGEWKIKAVINKNQQKEIIYFDLNIV